MDVGDDRATGGARNASFAQQRLWFLDQLRPGLPDYLLPLVLRLRGALDVAALTGALCAIVERHEVLRTRYAMVDGALVQETVAVGGLNPELVDVSGLPAGDREHALTQLVARQLRVPVDLTGAVAVRVVLARVAADDHLLLFVVHHIAFDGWSWDVLGRELNALYRERAGGAPADLAPLPIQYADFAEWQHERLTGPRLTRQLAFWRGQLAGLVPLELPTDRPRPQVWDGAGDVVRFTLPAALVARVDRLARANRATRFMTLLAVFHTLLARYTGRTDIAIGTLVAGRTRADVERLIGMFVNAIVLRADVSGDPSFATLLGRVRAVSLAALTHAEAPFERVVDEIAPERDLARNPLFQVSFTMHNAAATPISLPGLDVELVKTPLAGSPSDLQLDMNLTPDGDIAVRLQYATALFDPATAARLADAYQLLLHGVLADPDVPVGQLPLLSDRDRSVLLAQANDTAAPVPDRCLHELFAEQAARTPDAVAPGSSVLSYRELADRSSRLAAVLRDHGIGPESVVGVCLPAGPDLAVVVQAVLTAGGAYLRLDTTDPATRRAGQLADVAARVLVTTADVAADLAGWRGTVLSPHTGTAAAPMSPMSPVSPDNAACVVVTADHTPVTVTHRNLVNHVVSVHGTREPHLVVGQERVVLSGIPVDVTDGAPIGAAPANTTRYVLDAHLRPVLPGAVGELYVGGLHVARGHHGRGDLTAARFVPDPFATAPGARLYRTGALARHRGDDLVLVSRGDRSATPVAGQTPGGHPDAPATVAPRTRAERAIASVWSEVLGGTEIGVHDSFFTLGGNSLAATRMAFRLRELFAIELPLAEVFAADTVAGLAEVVAEATRGGQAPIEAVPHDRPLPLSFAQQRLWFLDRMTPGATDYLVPVLLRLRGPLDPVALRAAVHDVVARHAILRTRYVDHDGEPRQVVDPDARPELAEAAAATYDDALRHVHTDLALPIDLGTDLPLRGRLVRISADDHLLALVMHHIAFDGLSTDVLVTELGEHYAARKANVPYAAETLAVQYADYAVWQRAVVAGAEFAPRLEHWRQRLAGLAPLELPADRRRPRVRDPRGGSLAVELPAELGDAVERLAHRHGATTFMVLLAAFQALLSRYTGVRDIAVGTPVAGRSRLETERLIGFFANTVVLRTDLSGLPSFDELVARVRQVALAAYTFADVPFERIVEELAPERDPARNPLFQVMFETRAASDGELALADLRAEQLGVAWPVAKFDLTVSVVERPDRSMRCGFEYAAALFDRETVARMGEHFRELLTALLADPAVPVHRARLVPAAEHGRLAGGWADTTAARPDRCLHDLVADHVRRTPDAIAVVSGDVELTYAELWARTTRLACRLRVMGVRAEIPVAVALRRDADLVTALLAVHRAGGVYVPVDPGHPRQRRDHVLTDSGAAVLVTQSWLRDDEPPALPLVLLDTDFTTDTHVPLPAVDPGTLAYIIHTSGSTGTPKGVAVTHEAIRNRVLWTVGAHGLGAGDRVLQKTTVTFDAAMWEFLAPLVCGATVVVADDGVPRDAAAMVRAVAGHRITVLQVVPSVLRLLIEQPGLAVCDALRLVFCAGEPLPAELCDRLLKQVPVTLLNTYGPTECAIDVTSWRYTGTEPGETVPIGHPIDNVRVVVLDADGELAPIGVPGELCVAGVALARGYVGRADLTADRFVPDPCPVVPGARLYRTGDRVRRGPDGRLEYLGRLDRQVKVRGVRVEPGEIEAVLTARTDVAQAVVGVYGTGADRALVAHVVAERGATLFSAQVRAHLADRLPASMVPSAIHVHDAFPLTTSGKVDRAALPGLDGSGVTDPGHRPPAGPAETAVAEVFAEVLGATEVGADADFFDLGGHSLLATRLVFRLRAAFGVDVPVAEVFARRSVARIAALLSTPGALAEDTAGVVVPIARARGGDGEIVLPASSAQRRLWFLDQLDPGSAEYLVPMALELTGPLDVAALAGAVDDLVARHEVLRTRYVARDGDPVQVVDPAASLEVRPVDLTALPREAARERAAALAVAETGRPFTLDTEWPLRVTLVRVAQDEHLLTLTAHHIAVDAWSTDLITGDLGAFYRARRTGEPGPDAPSVQYGDFADWQNRWALGSRCAELLAYWRTRLAGLSPLELPTDRPRAAMRDASGDLHGMELPAEVAAAVLSVARRYAVTPFVVLISAFHVMLSRYTGRSDIAVGTPTAGRTRPETEDVVGLFINTVVLRSDLGGDPTFAALLDRVRRDVIGAYSNQDVPFDRVVDELQPERDLGRNPLFQVMFELQHPQRTPLRIDGTVVRRASSPWRTAKFDLTVAVGLRADGGMNCLLEYATALFDRATVARMAGHFLRLLRSATETPEAPLSELVMLSDEERHALLHDQPGADGGPDSESVPALFARRVDAHPDAEAVTCGTRTLTYAELDAEADRLAHRLRALGVVTGSMVAVAVPRGADTVVALLAVLKAGAVYLPVDPGHPAARLAFILADAGAEVVVTAGCHADRLAGTGVTALCVDSGTDSGLATPADPGPAPEAGDLAYLIYTSGSTGEPKGVLVEHGSYAHHCRVIAAEYDIRPADRVLQLAAPTFDVAMDQIAATLLSGATVVVADPRSWSAAELPDRIAEHGVTIMEITPAHYREVMHHVPPGDPRLRGLRLVNVGSDVVTADDAARWAATGLPGRFLSSYGPTETTVTCVLHPVSGPVPGTAGTLPIGRPVPGTRAYVLDPAGEPVPVGVPGELYLGGVRLARGYHRRPGLTAEKFVPDPFGATPGGRLYKTGDLVRYRPDGALEFVGRVDRQVKLRGFRIEPGEIEAVLARHPALRAVAVVARELRPGDRGLAAYLVPHGDTAPGVTELRAHVAAHLPGYMVPSAWTVLPGLPLTHSGKVDREALPASGVDRDGLAGAYVAPDGPTEEILAGLWAEVLGVARVGAHDDVFALGAHSLLVTRVLARVCAVFDVDIPVRALFEATTVAALAEVVRTAVEAEIDRLSDDEVAALLAPGDSRSSRYAERDRHE